MNLAISTRVLFTKDIRQGSKNPRATRRHTEHSRWEVVHSEPIKIRYVKRGFSMLLVRRRLDHGATKLDSSISNYPSREVKRHETLWHRSLPVESSSRGVEVVAYEIWIELSCIHVQPCESKPSAAARQSNPKLNTPPTSEPLWGSLQLPRSFPCQDTFFTFSACVHEFNTLFIFPAQFNSCLMNSLPRVLWRLFQRRWSFLW